MSTEDDIYYGCCAVECSHGASCTLDQGHDGDHESWGLFGSKEPACTWPREDIERRMSAAEALVKTIEIWGRP
jgi:hypothetical protein